MRTSDDIERKANVNPVNTARSFRRGLTFGLIGGAAITAVRYVQSRRTATEPAPGEWPPLQIAPEPQAPPAPPEPPPPPSPWIAPNEDGTCPDSHPVKGKLMSGIYHVVGGINYPRTRADRCYLDAQAAEDDGLRPSKR